MINPPVNDTADAISPLRDFQFARNWLAKNDFARSMLPSLDELLTHRLATLGSNSANSTNTWTPWNAAEIAELTEFNHAAGNDAGAMLAERLASPDALVVVTGQQPDLLASPLFVLHKALSAVAWARRLSNELNREVTPVFWVASDDDDFAELKQAWLAAWNGDLIDAGRKISRGNGIITGSPAYNWDLTESAPRLQADIERALHGWPGGDVTAQWLTRQIADEPNFERCFCRILATLLGDQYPMLFVAPRLNSIRRRGATILAADIEKHPIINSSVMAAADRFHQRNYPVVLARDEAALNFFWLHKGRRQRLIRSGKDEITAVDPVTRKEIQQFSNTQLHAMLDQTPESFAPNVVSRPVVQDTALPSAIYVAGPGEIAYLAILGEAYSHYNTVRCAITPRAMITMQSASEPQSTSADAATNALAHDNCTSREILDELTELSTEISTSLEKIRSVANSHGQQFNKSLKKTDEHITRGLTQFRRRLARQLATETWNEQARHNAINEPAGKPQERILAPWNFVKAGEWDALAKHLYNSADYTATGPHTIALPPWLAKAI